MARRKNYDPNRRSRETFMWVLGAGLVAALSVLGAFAVIGTMPGNGF